MENTLSKLNEENHILRKENQKYKNRIGKLKTQNDVLCRTIASLNNKTFYAKTEPGTKIDLTVKFMRDNGASSDDIKAFVQHESIKLLNRSE